MLRNYLLYVSFLFLFLFNSNLSFASSLIYQENFEDNNASDTFGTTYSSYWETFLGCTAVVTNDPHSGLYSLRGSISENGISDNITGESGCVNSHNSFGMGASNYGNTSDFDVSIIDTGEFYVSWWVKFDSGELANLLSDTHKMIYLYTNGSANNLIIHINENGGMDLLVNADNQAGYPYSAGDNPSNNYQYGYDLGTFSSIDDGDWHHMEFYADWGTGGDANSILKIWVDGANVLDVSNAVAIYQDGDHVWTLTIPSNISAAGTSVSTLGWQVDDIEIWDGLPSSETTTPPDVIISPPHVNNPVTETN